MPTRKGAATACSPAHWPHSCRSLADLERWHADWLAAGRPAIEAVIPFTPRKRLDGPLLLVCDDTLVVDDVDLPFRRSWAFEHQQLADSYVFFGHRRVAVPPHETVTACHRAGVKCYGTFVLEGGEAQAEARQLLMLSDQTSSPLLALQGISHPENPFRSICTRYADMLVDMAVACGFEGYLMNVELNLGVPTDGQTGRAWSAEHAFALLAWVEYLRDEIARRVPGGHGQVIWYDSVTHSGQLAWQSRINEHNVKWMLATDQFFTVRGLLLRRARLHAEGLPLQARMAEAKRGPYPAIDTSSTSASPRAAAQQGTAPLADQGRVGSPCRYRRLRARHAWRWPH